MTMTSESPGSGKPKTRQSLNLKLAADIGAEIISGKLAVGNLFRANRSSARSMV
jgi:hypothetical protein